jgi:hypothetical protein
MDDLSLKYWKRWIFYSKFIWASDLLCLFPLPGLFLAVWWPPGKTSKFCIHIIITPDKWEINKTGGATAQFSLRENNLFRSSRRVEGDYKGIQPADGSRLVLRIIHNPIDIMKEWALLNPRYLMRLMRSCWTHLMEGECLEMLARDIGVSLFMCTGDGLCSIWYAEIIQRSKAKIMVLVIENILATPDCSILMMDEDCSPYGFFGLAAYPRCYETERSLNNKSLSLWVMCALGFLWEKRISPNSNWEGKV